MPNQQIRIEAPKESDLTYSPAIAAASNYHRWIFDALKPAIRGNLLEIGVGSAPLINWYDNLESITVADIRPEEIARVRDRWTRLYPNIPFFEIIGDAGEADFWKKLPPLDFDGIIAVNLLEHVSNDVSFMQNAQAKLAKKKGRIGLFVPAIPALYGTLDAVAGHYRRYTKKGLRRLAEQSGFVVDKIAYFNLPGALLWWFQGRILKISKLDDSGLNASIRLSNKIVPIIRGLERVIPMPFGQSLVLIGTAI